MQIDDALCARRVRTARSLFPAWQRVKKSRFHVVKAMHFRLPYFGSFKSAINCNYFVFFQRDLQKFAFLWTLSSKGRTKPMTVFGTAGEGKAGNLPFREKNLFFFFPCSPLAMFVYTCLPEQKSLRFLGWVLRSMNEFSFLLTSTHSLRYVLQTASLFLPMRCWNWTTGMKASRSFWSDVLKLLMCGRKKI